MVKTGNDIFFVLSIVATIAPLLPVIILFVRHAAPSPAVHLLRIVCIVVFAENLLLVLPDLNQRYHSLSTALLQLAGFGLLYCLFVQAALNQRLRIVMSMVLVSFVSVVVTIYSMRGTDIFPGTIMTLQSALLNLLALVALVTLIRNQRIIIFREPLFWIAGGVLCYFGTYLFIEVITRMMPHLSRNPAEKQVVQIIAGIVQFIFFSIAANLAPHRRKLKSNLHERIDPY